MPEYNKFMFRFFLIKFIGCRQFYPRQSKKYQNINKR